MSDSERPQYGLRARSPTRGVMNLAFDGSISQLDTLAPEQFLRTMRSSEMEPEKKVMFAVLEDAIHVYQKYIFASRSKERALFKDAEEWFLGGGDVGLFSFQNVCEILGYDANYLRKGLIEWKSRQSQSKIKRRI